MDFIDTAILYIINDDYEKLRTWKSEAKTLEEYTKDAGEYLDSATDKLIHDKDVIDYLFITEQEVNDEMNERGLEYLMEILYDKLYQPLFNVLPVIHPRYNNTSLPDIQDMYLDWLRDKYRSIATSDIGEYVPNTISRLTSKYL